MIKITAEATTSITGLIYTNFDVKPEYEKVLEPIEGVEWVRIRSRYSLFVGIGRNFDTKEVLQVCTEKLEAYMTSK